MATQSNASQRSPVSIFRQPHDSIRLVSRSARIPVNLLRKGFDLGPEGIVFDVQDVTRTG